VLDRSNAAEERRRPLRARLGCEGASAVDLGAIAADANHSFALVVFNDGNHLELYGHLWSYINAFFCTFAAARAHAATMVAPGGAAWPVPPTLTIYVGTGPPPTSRALIELARLFSYADLTNASDRLLHLRVVRVPWVPSSLGGCYVTSAPVPE
jgi:hypothetical protein